MISNVEFGAEISDSALVLVSQLRLNVISILDFSVARRHHVRQLADCSQRQTTICDVIFELRQFFLLQIFLFRQTHLCLTLPNQPLSLALFKLAPLNLFEPFTKFVDHFVVFRKISDHFRDVRPHFLLRNLLHIFRGARRYSQTQINSLLFGSCWSVLCIRICVKLMLLSLVLILIMGVNTRPRLFVQINLFLSLICGQNTPIFTLFFSLVLFLVLLDHVRGENVRIFVLYFQ